MTLILTKLCFESQDSSQLQQNSSSYSYTKTTNFRVILPGLRSGLIPQKRLERILGTEGGKVWTRCIIWLRTAASGGLL